MRSLLILIAIAICLVVQPGAALAQEPTAPLVHSVELRGLQRTDQSIVRERISLAPGSQFSFASATEDIKAIFSLGYFKDVRVEAEPTEGAIKVIYYITEKPSVRIVDIEAGEGVDIEEAKGLLTLKPGAIADDKLIKSNADALRQFYAKKGYPLATVLPVVREVNERSTVVVFYIEQGPEVKVKDVAITNLSALSEREVSGAMQNSPWWLMSWLTGGGKLDPMQLDDDREQVLKLYHSKGYIKAQVGEPNIIYTPDNRWATVSLDVQEGAMYRVGKVSFEGQSAYTEQELLERIKTRTGEPVDRTILEKDVATVVDMLNEKGFALAGVYPDVNPDDERHVADIIFRVNEGDIYRMGRISIKGNVRTRDQVVRRELKLLEGEYFSSQDLRRSYERVTNLGFFEDVRFKPQPEPSTRTIGLDVELKEKSTGTFNVGGGYSSVDRFVGSIDVTEQNLGGRGQYLKVKFEKSGDKTLYELSFREPWFLERKLPLDLSVFRQDTDYTQYNKRSTGASVGLGFDISEYWSTGASYLYEDALIYESTDPEDDGPYTTSSLSPYVTFDNRDNIFDPHTGMRHQARVSFAGMGGDTKFFKFAWDSSVNFPVSEKTTLSVRGRYGYAQGIMGEELPKSERYFVGGVFSVRGLRDVGPHDAEGIYLGGLKRLVLNVDYVFPLVEEMKLKGVVFFDAGTAYDYKMRPRYTAGAGFRWFSPIGPLRLEWAKNLWPEGTESTSRWEFTIGSMF